MPNTKVATFVLALLFFFKGANAEPIRIDFSGELSEDWAYLGEPFIGVTGSASGSVVIDNAAPFFEPGHSYFILDEAPYQLSAFLPGIGNFHSDWLYSYVNDDGRYSSNSDNDGFTIFSDYENVGGKNLRVSLQWQGFMDSFTGDTVPTESELQSMQFGIVVYEEGSPLGIALFENEEFTLTVVPVPAAFWLFGSALAGLGWFRRRQTA